MATISDLSLDPANEGLDKAVDKIAGRVKEMITQMNTNTAAIATNTSGVALINTALDAIPDPVTITLSTWTEAGVNAAFATLETQLKTLIDGIQA